MAMAIWHMITHGNTTLPCVKSGKTGQKVTEINAFSAPTDLQTRSRRVLTSFQLLAINCLAGGIVCPINGVVGHTINLLAANQNPEFAVKIAVFDAFLAPSACPGIAGGYDGSARSVPGAGGAAAESAAR
jgi:hypothetical protein